MSHQQGVTDTSLVKIELNNPQSTGPVKNTRKSESKCTSCRVVKSSTNERLSSAFRLLKFKRTLNKTLKLREKFKKSKPATMGYVTYSELTPEGLRSANKLPWETYSRKRKRVIKSKPLRIDICISMETSSSRNEKIQKYERLRRKRNYRNVSMDDLVRKKHNLNPQNEVKIKSGGDLKSYLLDTNDEDSEASGSVPPGAAAEDAKEFLVVSDLKKGVGLYNAYKDIISRVLKTGTSSH